MLATKLAGFRVCRSLVCGSVRQAIYCALHCRLGRAWDPVVASEHTKTSFSLMAYLLFTSSESGY